MADSGPLVAALNPRERAHRFTVPMVAELARSLLVPLPVVSEVDHLLRSRVSSRAARSFLRALSAGEHMVEHLSPKLLSRAVELDERYADLDLGLADTSVMAVAERYQLPILTFDFADFRATAPAQGHWRLLLDEGRFRRAIGLGT